jgi:hypothetical protein
LVVSPVALVCTRLPAVAASYHLKVPAVALLAARVTIPGPHVEPAVTVGAVGTAMIVAATDLRAPSQLAALRTDTK